LELAMWAVGARIIPEAGETGNARGDDHPAAFRWRR